MKKLVLVLAIAALMTSCQKDEFQSKQITPVNGDWKVEAMFTPPDFITSFLPIEIERTIDRIVINENLIFTYYSDDSNLEDKIEIFSVVEGIIHTGTGRLTVWIDAEGKLTIKYSYGLTVLATRN